MFPGCNSFHLKPSDDSFQNPLFLCPPPQQCSPKRMSLLLSPLSLFSSNPPHANSCSTSVYRHFSCQDHQWHLYYHTQWATPLSHHPCHSWPWGFHESHSHSWASQVALVVKNPSANAGRRKRHGFNPWVGRSPGGEHGNPLQYSCLENPMDRGTWRATVHGVAKSGTQLKPLSIHTHTHTHTESLLNPITAFFPLF